MTAASLKNSLIITLALCAACAKPAATMEPAPTVAETATTPGCRVDRPLVLEGDLHGALDIRIAASATEVACRGMPRPADRGVRLQFELPEDELHGGIVLIIGIDDVDRAATGQSIRSTVTVIDEGGNRFFSTGTRPSCYTDIARHDYRDSDNVSEIDGVLWCTAAIPQINGADSIRLTELRFAGRVTWPGAG